MNFSLKKVITSRGQIDHLFGVTLILIFGTYFFLLSIYANIDLSEGRHIIFMDEQIVYDGVYKLLHPNDLKTFILNILDGGDHRYGRILYNTSAFFSAIPTYIWGPSGQIISTRLLQTILLMSAYLIISFTFFRFWSMRALSFLLLLSFPTTTYYFTMPKPEPIQIFFIALFLWQAKKNNYKFGYHWIYFGMAFGAKISVLPFVLLFGLLALYQEKLKKISVILFESVKAILSFLVGFLISEPILLLGKWKIYLKSTFLNTTHGADDSSITMISWIEFIIKNVPSIYTIVLAISILLFFLSLVVFFLNIIKNKQYKLYLFEDKSYIILFFGLALLLIYILKVDRLWDMYLELPFVFIITGVLIFLERGIVNQFRSSSWVPVTYLGMFMMYILIAVVPYTTKKYINLANRTDQPHHIKKLEEYNYLKKFLKGISVINGEKIKVLYSPRLYLLETNEYYRIDRFWGWFLDWNKGVEVIVFDTSLIPDRTVVPKATNINYTKWEKAVSLYHEFVIERYDELPEEKLTYIQIKSDNKPDGLRIFLRSDIYKQQDYKE